MGIRHKALPRKRLLLAALGVALASSSCDDEAKCADERDRPSCDSRESCTWARTVTYNEDDCTEVDALEACIPVSGTEAGCTVFCDDGQLRFVRTGTTAPSVIYVSDSICGMRPEGPTLTCNEAPEGTCGCACE